MRVPGTFNNSLVNWAAATMEEIKVSPEELRAKADAASDSIAKMRNRLNELNEIIKRTSHYWIGDAGEQHRKTYFEQEKIQGEIMNCLLGDLNKMREIAGIFQDAENESVKDVAGLKGSFVKDAAGPRGPF